MQGCPLPVKQARCKAVQAPSGKEIPSEVVPTFVDGHGLVDCVHIWCVGVMCYSACIYHGVRMYICVFIVCKCNGVCMCYGVPACVYKHCCVYSGVYLWCVYMCYSV
jgi:hypothetical protein